MLRQLHIQNLAVIQDLTIELHPGLNCFTGQTGAGKSLIIGALEILLGLRQATDMLRKGAPEGRVSGMFTIHSENLRQEIANATDLPLEAEPEVLIARRIFPPAGGAGTGGRTSASINGQPITSAMLKQVGEILVDVHGQHDAQYLLKPANQLAVLDEFGDSMDLRRRFSDLFHQRQELLAQQQELAASRTLRRQQLELYEFQAREIDDANILATSEYEDLAARNRVLANIERLKRSATSAYAELYEEEGSILSRLKSQTALLLELADLDNSLKPVAQQIREAELSLDDAAFSLRRYADRLDLDPAELAENNARLNALTRLIDKYVGRNGQHGGLDEVLRYRYQIQTHIDTLKAQDEDFSTSAAQLAALDKQLATTGEKLSAARKKAAAKLTPLVHEQLADLGMKEARFAIDFQTLKSDISSAPEEKAQRHKGTKALRDVPPSLSASVPQCLSASSPQSLGALSLSDFSTSSGLETTEFMIAPNPGQPARPLRRIASGGELSRVMLALKSITAQRGGADRVSVLVFDEIDANVGGRMGTIIGNKLRALAAIHQVLCITHLPQIAAFADHHLTIRKQTIKDETLTTVTVMHGDERLHEIAEMTTGKDITPTALAQAQELLAAASPAKPVRPRKPARTSP